MIGPSVIGHTPSDERPGDERLRVAVDRALGTTRHVFEPDAPFVAANPTLFAALGALRPGWWRASAAGPEEAAAAGGLSVNGRPASRDVALSFPCRIEFFEATCPRPLPPFDPDRLIYSAGGVVVYAKPPGLPSVPSRSSFHGNLLRQLEGHLGRAVHLPSRLDTATAGLVVAAADPAAARTLQHAFETRRVSKLYLAEVSGTPPDAPWTVTLPIGRHPAHPVLRAATGDGRPAETRFAAAELRGAHSLLAAAPVTGRTHQIRVHAAATGVPVRGDPFYGRPGDADPGGLRLLAYSVSFPDPAGGGEVTVTLPPGFAPPWAFTEGGGLPGTVFSL